MAPHGISTRVILFLHAPLKKKIVYPLSQLQDYIYLEHISSEDTAVSQHILNVTLLEWIMEYSAKSYTDDSKTDEIATGRHKGLN